MRSEDYPFVLQLPDLLSTNQPERLLIAIPDIRAAGPSIGFLKGTLP